MQLCKSNSDSFRSSAAWLAGAGKVFDTVPYKSTKMQASFFGQEKKFSQVCTSRLDQLRRPAESIAFRFTNSRSREEVYKYQLLEIGAMV